MHKHLYNKKTALFSIIILLIVATFGVYSVNKITLKTVEPSYAAPQYPIEKRLRYSFTLTNRSQQFIENSEFWTYAPMAQTATQKTYKINSSLVHEIIKDKYQNQILYFKIKNMAPYSQKNISIDAVVKLANKPNLQPTEALKPWLKLSSELTSKHNQITHLANQLKQETHHQGAKSIYQWVANNIQYSGYNPRERSLESILETKQGDCTEYMRLFTMLARKNQIPTREVAGYISRHNQILHYEDLHNWAEYYHEDSWHLVDAQNKNFRDQYQNYIAFRHYGDDPRNPLNSIHRYKISDKRIKVTMN